MEKYFDCCICGQIIDINAGDDYTSLENKVCAEAIASLKTLLNAEIDYVEVKGNFDKVNSYTKYYKAELLTDKFINIIYNNEVIKQKVNQIEIYEAVPSLNLEESAYYKNMIDSIIIYYK